MVVFWKCLLSDVLQIALLKIFRCILYLIVYNFTRFRCAENCTQDHFRCVMVCYRTRTPQKDKACLHGQEEHGCVVRVKLNQGKGHFLDQANQFFHSEHVQCFGHFFLFAYIPETPVWTWYIAINHSCLLRTTTISLIIYWTSDISISLYIVSHWAKLWVFVVLANDTRHNKLNYVGFVICRQIGALGLCLLGSLK